MARILLVEDDNSLGATLSENLQLEGYQVNWKRSGADGLLSARAERPDLIVLDVMLPELSGLEVLKEVRAHSAVPVLMISAKGTSNDRIHGLELEADDYLPKPFHLKEFLLRVQALLRRAGPSPSAGRVGHHIGRTTIGKADFDFERLEVKSDGSTESLSPKELGLLMTLMQNVNRVVSREEILQSVWGKEELPTTRTIDNFIVKLRRLIETDPQNPKYIISHRGVGYSLQLETERGTS